MPVTEQSVTSVIRAARPAFRNAHDKVAFAVHASFFASGFVLRATGPSAFTDDAFHSSSTEEVGIDHWNELDDRYGFLYSSPEKGSKKILVKCLALNDKLLVDVLREGDSKPAHLEINVKDYVVEGGRNRRYASMFKDFGKLVATIDKEILSKYNGSSAASSSSQKASLENRGGLTYGVCRPRKEESKHHGPSTSDPLLSVSHIKYQFALPPVSGIDDDDLFPGPGAGVYRKRGDFGGSGSMLVGPNDRRFFGGVGRELDMPEIPPVVVPPGARFDPYGPPTVPGFEPYRFIRDPSGPGRETHPDLEPFRNYPRFM